MYVNNQLFSKKFSDGEECRRKLLRAVLGLGRLEDVVVLCPFLSLEEEDAAARVTS